MFGGGCMPAEDTRTTIEFVIESSNRRVPSIPRPSQIMLWGDRVRGGFGKCEVEETAGRLVLFMVERLDLWSYFKLTDLADFYKRKGWNPNHMLDGLTGVWIDVYDPVPRLYETEIFLVSLLSGEYCVTKEFIRRCAKK
jgi:hypothetical protein